MTNEQLAVLLSSYAARLETIVSDVELGLPDEVTRANEWWHDGKKISAMEQISIGLCEGKGREKLKSEGYELRSTGCAFILAGMRGFISDLREVVSLLSSNEETWKTS